MQKSVNERPKSHLKPATHLLTVLQFNEHTVVVGFGDPFREAAGRFDEHLERPVQQLVDLAVVVVVVPNAVHALDVVPDGTTELGRIDVGPPGNRVVRKVVRQPELVVQVEAHVVVETGKRMGRVTYGYR